MRLSWMVSLASWLMAEMVACSSCWYWTCARCVSSEVPIPACWRSLAWLKLSLEEASSAWALVMVVWSARSFR